MMRISVEIDEKKLKKVKKLTGISKQSPAVAVAIDEFLLQKEKEAFLKEVIDGRTDYRRSNDEVEAMNPWDDSETKS